MTLFYEVPSFHHDFVKFLYCFTDNYLHFGYLDKHGTSLHLLTGSTSSTLLTEDVLNYLIENLVSQQSAIWIGLTSYL